MTPTNLRSHPPPSTPAARQQLRELRVREVWAESRVDATIRTQALEWLDEHPSPDPTIDHLWRQALQGRGPLYRWLEGDDLALEQAGLASRVVIASHPFVTYLRCSALEKSGRS